MFDAVLKSENGLFIFSGPRELARKARFSFDAIKKVWYTPMYSKAAILREYADNFTKNKISRKIILHSPWNGTLSLPKDKTLLPFQPDVIKFALERNRSYLALDPGLGKTICAIVFINTLLKKGPCFCIYLCPPFLTLTVEDEFTKWKTFKFAPQLFEANGFLSQISIMPNSLLARRDTLLEIKDFIKTLPQNTEKVLIVDEAHQYNSGDSLRSEALLGCEDPKKEWNGIAPLFDRVVLMSGTPFQRPLDLFPMLRALAPECIDFKGRIHYGFKYCGARRNAYGKWDFTGASSVKELGKKIKGKFLLRLRKDVLGLPPKTEEILFIGDTLKSETAALERTILQKYSPEDLMQSALKESNNIEGDLHVSTYRKLLGIEKVPGIAQAVKGIMDGNNISLLLFLWHKEVVKLLQIELQEFEPIIVTREFSVDERFKRVKEFQTNKKRRLFIGNIKTAGVGYTLTKATRVLLAEPSWNPSDNDQAGDRAHRHGQKNSVHVQYLLYKNSLDRKIIEANLRKRNNQNAL